jgi:hypothetical protein
MKKTKKSCSCNKCDRSPGQLLMMLSVTTLIVSAMVSIFKIEMYLAGTQWILVSILLAIYANAFFMGSCDCGCDKK